ATTFYGRSGASRGPAPSAPNVVYQVKEDSVQHAKVGNVYILGNDLTHDTVIRRNVGTYPEQRAAEGDARNLDRLERKEVDTGKLREDALKSLTSSDARGWKEGMNFGLQLEPPTKTEPATPRPAAPGDPKPPMTEMPPGISPTLPTLAVS